VLHTGITGIANECHVVIKKHNIHLLLRHIRHNRHLTDAGHPAKLHELQSVPQWPTHPDYGSRNAEA
jgi:hypothetical protein